MSTTHAIERDDAFSADDHWLLELGDGLVASATERPDSPILERFFAGYDKAFVLPDEREELDGFRVCLALNPTCRHWFSRRHTELAMIMTDGMQGPVLGGANFLATAMPDLPGHPPVAMALNYIYVDEQARGRGLSRRLLDAAATLANRAVADGAGTSPAIFIEQNDPLLMSPGEYATDTARSGVDQVDRLRIWERLGARIVDFPYVQPALSASQAHDDSLAYAVLGFPLARMSARYLHDHLESFFAISVLKAARTPDADPVAGGQLRCLRAMAADGEDIALLPMHGALERLRDHANWQPGMPLRAFARMT